MTESEVSPQNRRDLAVAGILVLLTSLLYLSTIQGRIFGNDGAMLADWFSMPESAFTPYHNALYLPAAHAFAAVWPVHGPLVSLYALSAVCGGLAVGVVYLCARSFVARRDACLLAAAMFAVTPAVWFFATTIEVHSLHLLVVAGCALVILRSPWDRPVLALAITAAVLPVTYISHQSAPILGPGWVMLAQWARSRRARPFSLPALAGVGLLYLGALVVGHLVSNLMRDKGMSFDVAFVADTVSFWRQSFGFNVIWEALISPYALLVVAVPLAIIFGRVSRLESLTVAAFLVTSVAFFMWWGIIERGGYLLGPAIFAAILMAKFAERCLSHRHGRFLLGLALVLQLLAGAVFVRGFDAEGFQLSDRIARIERFLGGEGVVIAANNNAPNAGIWLPEVREFNLRLSMTTAKSSEQWLAQTVPMIEVLVGAGPAILDTSYRKRVDLQGPSRERLDALEAELERIFAVTRMDDEFWPMWVLRAK